MTLRAGDVLGRYQVLCAIGAGGMAEVYAARVVGAESFERLVALKVMLPHLSGDPKFVRMFVDEARVAGRIESAHVVGTLDLGKDEREGLFQVLELVIGSSLRQLLDASEEPLPVRVALTILSEAARGLADAHAARGADGEPLGLVHRDVSPHNVLVGLDGRARLSDFGVARAAASVSATESGELKGKLAYAAPEQLRGETAVQASDVFALGVVIWEVLAARRLFAAENPLALVDMMMSKPIPRLDAERPELGAELAGLCARALERDREARTITAVELARGLEAAAATHGGLASREEVGALVRARSGTTLATLETTIRRRAAELAAAAPERARPTPALGAPGLSRSLGAAVVALLVVVLGVTVWRGPGARGSPDGPEQRGPSEPVTGAPPHRSGATPARDTVEGAEPAPTPELAVEAETVPPPSATSELAPPRTPATERARPERAAASERTATPPPPDRTTAREEPDASIGGTPTVAEPREPAEVPHETEGGLLGIEDFDRSGSH